MENNVADLPLSKLRDSLLELHKTLVDMERASYEGAIGPIQSPNQFLQLLTNDPWFAWLRPLSQLIVEMDKAMEESETVGPKEIQELFRQARSLLVVSEEGEGFGRNYFEALQNAPDVVLAHAQVARLLREPKK